jgi:hypothetical protein
MKASGTANTLLQAMQYFSAPDICLAFVHGGDPVA